MIYIHLCCFICKILGSILRCLLVKVNLEKVYILNYFFRMASLRMTRRMRLKMRMRMKMRVRMKMRMRIKMRRMKMRMRC